MVARSDIFWADLGPPAERRPACVLTRDAAISVLTSATCAPITWTIRGIRSDVELGPEHGLSEACVISCDNVIAIPVDAFDGEPVGHLDEIARARLDQALRYALDIVYRAAARKRVLARPPHETPARVVPIAGGPCWSCGAISSAPKGPANRSPTELRDDAPCGCRELGRER